MILKACKSKNYTFYYVQKSFRTNDGKCSTKNVERLGTIEDLKARFGDFDPVGEARKYVAELTAAGKASGGATTAGTCFFRRYIMNWGWTMSAKR